MTTRVYVDGVFDLFHIGHINLLKQAKQHGDVLIVGVITDKDVESYKRRPVMQHEDRVEMLRHCDLVDEVVSDPPLVLTRDFLEQHHIDVVVHGDDSKQEEFFHIPIEMGIMRYVSYTQRISTTEIIARIKERLIE